MKMDFGVLFFVCTMSWKMASSLHCYKCAAQFDTYSEHLCRHFNSSSDLFKDECKHSTMCYKKVTSYPLQNGVEIIERGCAKQTVEGYQEHTKDGWKYVNKIHEPYKERCEESPANSDRITNTLNCYCRGDYCNGTTRIGGEQLVLMIGLLFVLRY